MRATLSTISLVSFKMRLIQTLFIALRCPLIHASNRIEISISCNIPLEENTEIFISGFTGIQGIQHATASPEFRAEAILDFFYASYSTFKLQVEHGHRLMPGNRYRLTIELHNEAEEQESPDVYTYGLAFVDSPTSTAPLRYALPESFFDTKWSFNVFDVLHGQRPMKLVKPFFPTLGPFYMTNPMTSGENTEIQLVLQVNVLLTAGSYIVFAGFRDINPGSAQVTCYTSSAFAEEAQWNPDDESFRVDLIDSLEAHTVYTLHLDFIQQGTPVDPDRETYVYVSAHVEVGDYDSMIEASRAKILVDLGNLPPSFQLETSVLMVLEEGTVATQIAKDMSPGPFGYYISSDNLEVRHTNTSATQLLST